MKRRHLLSATATAFALPLWAQAPSAAAALRRGGVVLLLRHAQTDPGVGDPPGFRLNVCSTQRNLSDVGRNQAAQIRAWFAREQLSARAIKSSQWCRCRDTAQIAFGTYSDWPALNNFFEDRSREPAQTAQSRAALQKLPREGFEVWVTHGVVIAALTGQSPAQAEGFVVDASATVIARTIFE